MSSKSPKTRRGFPFVLEPLEPFEPLEPLEPRILLSADPILAPDNPELLVVLQAPESTGTVVPPA